ncbi:MAG: DinB family protein [Ignavibacteria bacterium]|nr:DinB family protein [Ignavibacteria bacterium]
MYNSLDDFFKDFKIESENTLKVFQHLTNESLSKKVYPEGRTLGRIAWHIVTSIPESFQQIGLKLECPDHSLPPPKVVSEFSYAYETCVHLLVENLKKNFTDEDLNKEFEFYGEKLLLKDILYGFIKHEIHHRAQMIVLMRQASLTVPGIYGPSKEEWKEYGMEPQE